MGWAPLSRGWGQLRCGGREWIPAFAGTGFCGVGGGLRGLVSAKSGPPRSRGWGSGGLEFEEDGFDFFDVGVGGEAPDSDVAATEVAVGVPVDGNGDPFVVYFLPVG